MDGPQWLARNLIIRTAMAFHSFKVSR